MSKVKGFWTEESCAYEDRQAVTLAAYANDNRAATRGFLNYLSFSSQGVKFQNGPVMDGPENVTIHDVPKEVAESAIKAAMGVVIGHLLANGAKL